MGLLESPCLFVVALYVTSPVTVAYVYVYVSVCLSVC